MLQVGKRQRMIAACGLTLDGLSQHHKSSKMMYVYLRVDISVFLIIREPSAREKKRRLKVTEALKHQLMVSQIECG